MTPVCSRQLAVAVCSGTDEEGSSISRGISIFNVNFLQTSLPPAVGRVKERSPARAGGELIERVNNRQCRHNKPHLTFQRQGQCPFQSCKKVNLVYSIFLFFNY